MHVLIHACTCMHVSTYVCMHACKYVCMLSLKDEEASPSACRLSRWMETRQAPGRLILNGLNQQIFSCVMSRWGQRATSFGRGEGEGEREGVGVGVGVGEG